VLTPFTATDEQIALLFPHAVDEFTADDPGCSETAATRALAYLIAHYLSSGTGQTGIQSGKIDDYSYTLAEEAASTSQWYAMYQHQISRCREARAAILVNALDGIDREDTVTGLQLDQNPVPRIRRERCL